MACCGPSIPRMEKEVLLRDLRNDDEDISLVLNKVNMTFDSKTQIWKSNSLFIIFNFKNLSNFRK